MPALKSKLAQPKCPAFKLISSKEIFALCFKERSEWKKRGEWEPFFYLMNSFPFLSCFDSFSVMLLVALALDPSLWSWPNKQRSMSGWGDIHDPCVQWLDACSFLYVCTWMFGPKRGIPLSFLSLLRSLRLSRPVRNVEKSKSQWKPWKNDKKRSQAALLWSVVVVVVCFFKQSTPSSYIL